MNFRQAIICLLSLTLLTSVVFAGSTGKITGTVKDKATGEPLIGANVILIGTSLGAATDLNGYYVILNVPPGKYTLRASLIGYKKMTVENVAVSVDKTSTVNWTMEDEALELGQEIVIEANKSLVIRDKTSSEVKVSSESIENMPVNDVSQIITLQAGVVQDRGGAIHIRGGRSSEVAYWVDGVPITDGFGGGQTVTVDQNSISEVQVISGTFNAEYGQATSGVVNQVTKEGSSKFEGGFQFFSGDYVTSRTSLYRNLEKISPLANTNYQINLSGPVPFTGNNLGFFISTRRNYSDGWLYGRRDYLTRMDTVGVAPVNGMIVPRKNGDGKIIPMNNQEQWFWQSKLIWNVDASRGMKLNFSFIGNQRKSNSYDHGAQLIPNFLNPDGDYRNINRGFLYILGWNHAVDAYSFYNLSLSLNDSYIHSSLYGDGSEKDGPGGGPDSRYLPQNDQQVGSGSYTFLRAGTQNNIYYRTNKALLFKGEYTIQYGQQHLVKAGLQSTLNNITNHDIFLSANKDGTGKYYMFVPALSDPGNDYYRRRPYEISSFLQDKIEFDYVIVNLGLRMDYFNSNSRVLADVRDPDINRPKRTEMLTKTMAERKAVWYKDSEPELTFSPRLGIAYPISETGVLHFSFGQFTKFPDLVFLFANPEFKRNEQTTINGPYGNANLKSEKTTSYEFGIQQEFGDYLYFEGSIFYKDIRDWVSVSAPIKMYGDIDKYTQYINKDYANAKGVVLNARGNFSKETSYSVSYTYMTADGVNSNPQQEMDAITGNASPVKTLIPLDWDVRHNLNINLVYNPDPFSISLISRFASGFPYTPSFPGTSRQGSSVLQDPARNSRTRPYTITFDLFSDYRFAVFGQNMTVFCKVFNLFDTANEYEIFTDTGRAGSTNSPTAEEIAGLYNPNRPTSIQDYLKHPEWYSSPREIQLGVSYNF